MPSQPLRPNIVYLHSHDTGRRIQPYGYAVPTPNIQRLAEEGILFRKAFCAAPTCSPSRAALLTGQSPHNSGMLGLVHRNFALYDYNQHLVHTLRKAGYFSAIAGMQHVASDSKIIGYDVVLAPADDPGHHGETRAAEFIQLQASDFPHRPFFLDVGFNLTHRTSPGFFHRDAQRGDPRYVRPPEDFPDTPLTRKDMADFISAAAELDHHYGVVIDALRASGLLENTLILCTTDHGLPWPGIKGNCTDGGSGVLMILRGPGGFSGGKVLDSMVSQIDVFPTLCELLGVEKPSWLQGKSMLPLIQAGADEINEEIFCEQTYHASYEPLRSVRTHRWRYIRRFDGRTAPVIPNNDGGHLRALWIDNGWREQLVAEEELYDLLFDPAEGRNLAEIPAMATSIEPILNDMRQRLQNWMQRTNDPLLKGPVYIKGAINSDPNGLTGADRYIQQ